MISVLVIQLRLLDFFVLKYKLTLLKVDFPHCNTAKLTTFDLKEQCHEIFNTFFIKKIN